MKIWYFDICWNSRGSHRYKKKITAATIWQKNMYDLSFYVLYQLNHDIIYKMSNNTEIYFPIFLHFLLATVRLCNHIMTLTVKIWNEAFMLISTQFVLTFSWLFGEFQNFLTYQNLLTFSWLFMILTFSRIFPDLWEPCCWIQCTKVNLMLLNTLRPGIVLYMTWKTALISLVTDQSVTNPSISCLCPGGDPQNSLRPQWVNY